MVCARFLARTDPTLSFSLDLGEAPPLDILHAEEMLPFLDADFVNLNYVGMVQMSGRLRLNLKAFDLGFAGELAGKNHLQGDQTILADLPGLIDHPHAAMGNFPEQLVITERVVFGFCHSRRKGGLGNHDRFFLTNYCARRLRTKWCQLGWPLKEISRSFVSAKERFHLRTHFRPVFAGFLKESPAFGWHPLQGLREQLADLFFRFQSCGMPS